MTLLFYSRFWHILGKCKPDINYNKTNPMCRFYFSISMKQYKILQLITILSEYKKHNDILLQIQHNFADHQKYLPRSQRDSSVDHDMWVFVTEQIILTRAIETYKDLFTCAMSEPHHSYSCFSEHRPSFTNAYIYYQLQTRTQCNTGTKNKTQINSTPPFPTL